LNGASARKIRPTHPGVGKLWSIFISNVTTIKR
jgi:hypothetical protein